MTFAVAQRDFFSQQQSFADTSKGVRVLRISFLNQLVKMRLRKDAP
jgi:hypothetical protein